MNPSSRLSPKNIEETARTLKTASRTLDDQIQQFETALGTLGLGVSAWVDVLTEEDEPMTITHGLGYARHKGKWALLYAVRTDLDDGDPQVWFLSDASREEKLRSVAKIPDLIRELDKEAQELLTRVSVSASVLQAFTEKIASNDPADDDVPPPLEY